MTDDNIVDFPDPALELKYTEYSRVFNSLFGVNIKGVHIDNVDGRNFSISVNGCAIVVDREQIAEFLHVALCFVDSENRYKPKVDLIGVNYGD